MADVAVLSANFGHFDEVRPQAEQDLDVDWIMFTDEPEGVPEPWKAIKRDPDTDSRIAAKRFKCCPPVRHRWAVWIDANMEVTSPSFAREVLASLHDGLALYRHPRRDCIYDEAEASLGAESQGGKYADQPIAAQVAYYRAEGHPTHWGLFACGTIAWDRSVLKARELGLHWFEECCDWSVQDQLSLPVVCRRMGVEPGIFPHEQIERRRPVLSNRWLKIHAHL